ncbi:conserved hypothetical protein [Syntrophobacter sp. SbD1]|nr:conserved hypothetical protein [Syntrophobacter sp. SbD1]
MKKQPSPPAPLRPPPMLKPQRPLKPQSLLKPQPSRSRAAKQVKTELVAENRSLFDMHGTGIAADNGEGGVEFNMKGIKVNVGGFIEAAGIYRSRNETSDIGSPFQNIPLPYASKFNANYFQDETRFSARQSRLSILAQGDYSPTIHLAGYYEMDFLGAAPTANSNESNSYNLRIRHLYLTDDWDTCGLHFLAGQTWSLVTQNTHGITPRQEEIPLTIDAQYVPGFNWTRQAQFRIVKDWDKQFWLGLSVENPQTTYVQQANLANAENYALNQSGEGGGLLNQGGGFSVNDIPDIVAKAAWESCWGHFEVFDLVRSFRSTLTVGPNGQVVPNLGGHSISDQNIIRDSVGGGFDIPIIPKQLSLQATAMYGDGIGRYGSGQLPDVTQDNLGEIHPITALHFLGGLTWQPCAALQFYTYYGLEQANRVDLSSGTTGFGYGSQYYDEALGVFPNPQFQGYGQIQSISQITVGDWWSFYQGKFGTMKLGLQYSFTTDNYFSGTATQGSLVPIGGPSTNDHMFFTSFRYYWN